MSFRDPPPLSHWVTAGLAAILFCAPASALAGDWLVLSDRDGIDAQWPGFMSSLSDAARIKARPAALNPIPKDPSDADLDKAKAAFEQGEDAFLALKLKLAIPRFGKARQKYKVLMERHPFSKEAADGFARSAFYQALAQTQGRKKRDAQKNLTALLTEYPWLTPDPGIFPPAFRQQVKNTRIQALGKKRVVISVEARPAEAMINVGGLVLEAKGGRAQLELPPGKTAVTVAWPGFGARTTEIDLSADTDFDAALVTWPAGMKAPPSGRPLDDAALAAIKGHGFEGVLWVTGGSALDVEGTVVFAQALPAGSVTAAVLLEPGAPLTDAIRPLTEALTTPEREVLRADGSEDDALADRLDQILGGGIIDDDPPGDTDSDETFRLGLDLGSGLGLATKVSNPGLAPTLLFVRPELAFVLGESAEIGLAARVQVVKFTALGEALVRWRLPGVRLRAGVMVGQITHTLLETENKKTSTEGFVGPTLGLEIPLGPTVIGVAILAPVHPDPTIHADLFFGIRL